MLLLSAPGADVVRPAAAASKLGAGDSLTAFFFATRQRQSTVLKAGNSIFQDLNPQF
jgi:hypothetical protein